MKKRLNLIILSVFILVMSIYLKSTLLNSFLGNFSDTIFYAGQLVIEFILILLSIYVLKELGKQELFIFKKPKLSYSLLVPLFYIFIIVWNGLSDTLFPTTENQQVVETVLENSNSFILSSLLLVVVAPIYEELVYRGLVMSWLENYRAFYVDILVSSTLFSVLHIVDKGFVFTDFLHYFGTGLILALLYRKTKRLGYPLALHFLINFMAWLVLTFVYS